MRLECASGLTKWQAQAVQHIEAGLLEYETQQNSLGKRVDFKKCKKWISANKYPFGIRQNHPYSVWRQELKILDEFFAIGIAFCHYKAWRNTYRKVRGLNSKNEKLACNENQLALF